LFIPANLGVKSNPTIRPVLDGLTGIGMTRRLKDGRYAA
jgi:hypothetical protein